MDNKFSDTGHSSSKNDFTELRFDRKKSTHHGTLSRECLLQRL